MQIVELTGLSWPTVRAAIDLFEGGGAAALKSRARGKQKGEDRSHTPQQEEKIRKLICDKRTEQLKMDFALWTRAAVMLLIERECAIKLSVRAVGNYLRRWGFTPKNRSDAPTSSARRRSRNGSTRNIRRSQNAPNPRAARSIEAMRRRSSTPLFAAAAMLQKAKLPWPMRRAAERNCR